MNLILSGFGSYPDFFDIAVKCAMARACVPVHVLTELPEHLLRLTETFIQAMGVGDEWSTARAYWCIRWLAIYEHVKDWPQSEFPIFCADWDFLVCRDLRPGFKAMAQYDYSTTYDNTGSPMSPHVINHIEPLKSFVDYVHSMVENKTPMLRDIRDMEQWEHLGKLHRWNVGDMEFIDGDTPEIFDHGIHINLCSRKRRVVMETDPRMKKVKFIDRTPHFVMEKTNEPVQATVIHCWAGFKYKMSEFAQEMGIQ